MNRTQKEAFVTDLNSALQGAESIVVSHYRGLTVADMESLRHNVREVGGSVQVAKNRLAKIAFKGTAYENLEDLMTGPTVLTMAEDPISAAKAAQKFAEDNDNFVILGGAMGEQKLTEAEVAALAKMPSLDELRAKLIGLLSAPATQIATVTQEPAAKLARVLAAKAAA